MSYEFHMQLQRGYNDEGFRIDIEMIKIVQVIQPDHSKYDLYIMDPNNILCYTPKIDINVFNNKWMDPDFSQIMGCTSYDKLYNRIISLNIDPFDLYDTKDSIDRVISGDVIKKVVDATDILLYSSSVKSTTF
eukprot:GHVR01193114.1.p1 GENE.GHVR01193114.1~~GHVR01193114.1.p1  ORF type:complete len:133 (+),score=16.73 GHVR01193114.1:496-894(+)